MRKLLAALLAMSALSMATAQHQFDANYPDVHDPVMAKGEDGRSRSITGPFLICHAYDSEVGARSKLYVRPMTFDGEGWIALGK